MADGPKLITENISYFSKIDCNSISKYKVCIDRFSSNFQKEITLETDTLIFLDTNVLLRYYSISFTARKKLYDFLSNNKKRIILTQQVQLEFLRNREDIIQRFFDQVTSKIPQDFNTDIVNKMQHFLEQYKIILKDYSFVEKGILEHQAALEGILTKLNESVESKKKEHIDLTINDDLLDFLATCNQSDELSLDELKIIKSHFDLLSKNIASEKLDSFISKPNSAFPGVADIKNKPENPYGDFIIFHEIMKYLLNRNIDAIFLTFDDTKGDWMSKNKAPHLHYVQNMYANTGQILYIMDAERALGKLLNIDIDSLVSAETNNCLQEITSENLIHASKKFKVFEGAIIKPFNSLFIKELKINGYKLSILD